MNEYISSRIQQCYPTHRLEEVDADACNFDYAERAYPGIVKALADAGASITDFGYGVGLERVLTAHVTSQCASYEDWHAMTQDQKQQYLGDMGLWVQAIIHISTVAPAFEVIFNVFKLREPDERHGWLDVTIPKEPPTQEWKDILNALRRACKDAGLMELTHEEQREIVPYVLETIYGDDDSPPELDPANLGQCLFQSW